VAFTPPTYTGTTLLYTATCTDGITSHTGVETTSPVTVTGLTNGVSYTCTVSAANSAGTSPTSSSLAKVVRPASLAPLLNILLD